MILRNPLTVDLFEGYEHIPDSRLLQISQCILE